MNGIIPLYKPKGMTSHDCVMRVRRILKMKKVGHSGTLDPNVEGVLTICIGEATKIIPYLLDLQKEYIAEVSLGIATDTEDAEGNAVEEVTVTQRPDKNEMRQVLAQFTGEITQIPPMYSAVKVKGKKLYEYAREGIEVERPERKVTIYELELLPEKIASEIEFSIRVLCSKGTYIRTLCVDIGRRLGYPAHMSQLVRTQSDNIPLNKTVTFEELEQKASENRVADIILPLTEGLLHLPTIEVNEIEKQRILQGQKRPLIDGATTQSKWKILHQGELLAIYEIDTKHNSLMKPSRVFNMHKK